MPKFKRYVWINGREYKPGDEAPKASELPEGFVIDPANFGEEEEDTLAMEKTPVYSGMKDKELQTLLKDRGLPTEGTHRQLVDRLEADDKTTK